MAHNLAINLIKSIAIDKITYHLILPKVGLLLVKRHPGLSNTTSIVESSVDTHFLVSFQRVISAPQVLTLYNPFIDLCPLGIALLR